MRLPAVLLILAPALAGCPNTDPAIFVDPSIDSPSLTVGQSVLVMGITGGGFTLDLHLGARASGPSTVTLGEFSVTDAQMATTFVSSLEVQASGSNFATGTAVVQPDSTLSTTFTIPMKQTDISGLCKAGTVVIAGAITDSLQGRQVPVYSSPFNPTGCP